MLPEPVIKGNRVKTFLRDKKGKKKKEGKKKRAEYLNQVKI
jgi:hypothetical protein